MRVLLIFVVDLLHPYIPLVNYSSLGNIHMLLILALRKEESLHYFLMSVFVSFS